jgi:very-short-patch-repair endonuclease
MITSNYFRKIKCICANCSKIFYLSPSRIANGRGKHCSKACFKEKMPSIHKGKKGLKRYGSDNSNWRGISAEKECLVCKSLFKKPTLTCSRICGDKYRATKITGNNNPFLKKHPAKIKVCHHCKKEFFKQADKNCGKYFCSSSCYVKGRSKSPRQLNIANQLKQKGYEVHLEKSWEWLHRPGIGQRMRVDLWLPDFNLAIEYDGEQHHERAFGNTEEQFNLIKIRDKCKNGLLKSHNIRLIRLSGWPIDIEQLIMDIKNTLAC